MFCLAPVLGMLAMFSLQTSWHGSPDVGSVDLQARTCQTGLQAIGKVSPAGYYAGEVGYGVQLGEPTGWHAGLVPSAGVSYVDHPNVNLPLRTQFSLSLAGFIGYDRVGLQAEYQHMSNAGLRDPNVGMDFVKVGLTWRF